MKLNFRIFWLYMWHIYIVLDKTLNCLFYIFYYKMIMKQIATNLEMLVDDYMHNESIKWDYYFNRPALAKGAIEKWEEDMANLPEEKTDEWADKITLEMYNQLYEVVNEENILKYWDIDTDEWIEWETESILKDKDEEEVPEWDTGLIYVGWKDLTYRWERQAEYEINENERYLFTRSENTDAILMTHYIKVPAKWEMYETETITRWYFPTMERTMYMFNLLLNK